MYSLHPSSRATWACVLPLWITISTAWRLGCFVQRKGALLSDIDLNIFDSFGRHLRRCGQW